MLISLHLPKTAGTSFGQSLKAHFSAGYREDYADLPINTPPRRRNVRAVMNCLANAFRRFEGVQCIHGHFLPLKYRLLGSRARFVTWLRDPVERLASHYLFWQRSYHPNAPPLHRRVIEERWTLERFCLGPELRNLYSQFLWGCRLTMFDFVGVVEYFDEDFAQFASRYLGTSLQPVRVNTNTTTEGRYITDTAFRATIEAYHQRDMLLYETALRMRGHRELGERGE